VAKQYNNKSVAEQNSVDLCWNLLMDSDYTELRQTIYGTDGELKRFRQLVVNSVMATDIVDKELKNLRNARWEKAFSEAEDSANRDSVNRKATIVIEHLIQSSDIAHVSWLLAWCRYCVLENMEAVLSLTLIFRIYRQCNIGTFTASGTSDSSTSATRPTRTVVPRRIHL